MSDNKKEDAKKAEQVRLGKIAAHERGKPGVFDRFLYDSDLVDAQELEATQIETQERIQKASRENS